MPGAFVFLKRRSATDETATLTTNVDEADARHTEAVGTIEGAAFKLNVRGEALLKALE